MAVGRRVWAIADGRRPDGDGEELVGVLNAGSGGVDLEVTLYFTDREPAGAHRARVDGGRVLELRLGELVDPGTEYAAVIEASEPVVVQHVRRDGGRPRRALASTIPWAAG
jgi:hypothetical protein